jgi:RNA polymerase sigma factor (sigma-70 family)
LPERKRAASARADSRFESNANDGVPDKQRITMLPATRPAETQLTAIVIAAQSGDNLAWDRLVHRFDRMLRSVARSYRLAPQDVDDAVQATWVKLYEHIDSIRDAAAISGWLATTVRRESLHLLQRGVREHLTDSLEIAPLDDAHGPDARLLESERTVALTRALASLPDRQRRLMTLIAGAEGTNYAQIGAALDMPIGSIGPIRARSLARLARHPELQALAAGA